ncbi:MAG: hypothetical protein EXS32_08470 [Opitutus sp.]|nr:hypothetical protein [Opitutus sp.]
MKQRAVIAGLTVLGFAAGFATRTWTEADPALPPPPLTLMGEFGKTVVRPASPAKPPASGNRVRGDQAPDRAKLSADIQKLRPEIDAYRSRLDALDAEYEVELAKILNPEQRARRAERNQKRAADRESRAKEPAADKPLTDDEISKLRERPMLNLAYTFLVPMHVDMLRRELKLDDAQAEKVTAILRVKRDKIETLVDSVPPPSIMLSRLAPVAERLAERKK